MKCELKRIKKSSYDELMDKYIDNYKKTGELVVDEELLEKSSENILSNNEIIVVDLNIEKYSALKQKYKNTYDIEAEMGMLLHKELVDLNHNNIPNYYFKEKELWAYLTLKFFHSIMIDLKLQGDVTEEKIKQFLFNKGTVTRTGIQLYWNMVDKLESEDNRELTHIAFEFQDPVYAIYERTSMSGNPFVVKAFVESIIKAGRDKRLKYEARSKFPSYLSCYAGINILDVYDYNALVDLMVKVQKEYFK